uniref:PXA1 n=1 Tax=Arundo donax TaxID=35708 RepID=A0A0A9GQ30_ARUDO
MNLASTIAFSLEPPPKKAIDSACVRSLECMNLNVPSSSCSSPERRPKSGDTALRKPKPSNM